MIKEFRDLHEKWLIGTDDDAEMAQEKVMENLPNLLNKFEEISDYNYELQSLKALGTMGAGFRAFRAAQPALSQDAAQALWDKHTENIKKYWERIAEAVVYGVK